MNARLAPLSNVSLRLDQWRSGASVTSLFEGSSFVDPGLRKWTVLVLRMGADRLARTPGSLQLLYHFSVLLLTRAAWDAVTAENSTVIAAGQQACLTAVVGMVGFVESLVVGDFAGYWSSRGFPSSSSAQHKHRNSTCIFEDSPFVLSTCLTTLVRLTLQSDRTDQSEVAIWQESIATLRRLISALSDAKDIYSRSFRSRSARVFPDHGCLQTGTLRT